MNLVLLGGALFLCGVTALSNASEGVNPASVGGLSAAVIGLALVLIGMRKDDEQGFSIDLKAPRISPRAKGIFFLAVAFILADLAVGPRTPEFRVLRRAFFAATGTSGEAAVVSCADRPYYHAGGRWLPGWWEKTTVVELRGLAPSGIEFLGEAILPPGSCPALSGRAKVRVHYRDRFPAGAALDNDFGYGKSRRLEILFAIVVCGSMAISALALLTRRSSQAGRKPSSKLL